MRNIQKQKEEITKVLIDTRAVQKDTNQLMEKLVRTYQVCSDARDWPVFLLLTPLTDALIGR